jgi:hypothetical protein
MASFRESETKWSLKRTEGGGEALLARASSSAAAFDGFVMAFGGAERTPLSMNDLWKYTLPGGEKGGDGEESGKWTTVEEKGDCPTPRSEHDVVALGKYMLLFGGIDFCEESVYNDLYVLNTDTMEWKYAGESGVEVMARSSHSLTLCTGANGRTYIIVFGGANPNEGPLDDVQYAELPADLDDLGKDDFFVTWKTLELPEGAPQPCARESHSAVSVGGNSYIVGGKAGMDLFGDVWRLADSASVADAEPVWAWTKMDALDLPLPRAAHSVCAMTPITSAAAPSSSCLDTSLPVPLLCVFGGIEGPSLGPEMTFEKSFLTAPLDGSASWTTQTVAEDPATPMEARISQRMCTLASGTQAFIFAGMSPIEDFADAWILTSS